MKDNIIIFKNDCTSKNPRILMHTCCAPCSVYCIDTLRAEGTEPVSFWYNPNIHPFTEYKMRKNTLTDYAKSINMKLIIENEYGLRVLLRIKNRQNRSVCRRKRIREIHHYPARKPVSEPRTDLRHRRTRSI